MRRPAQVREFSLVAYGVALAAVAIAVGLRLALQPLLGEQVPFVTLFAAVVFAAWYGGRGPALLAFVAGALGVAYFILEPRYAFAIDRVEYKIGLFLYGVASMASVAMFASLDRARRRFDDEVAARRATEAASIQSVERFRLAAEAVNGIIYECNLKTGIVERTRGLYEVLGYRPDEVPSTAGWWVEQIHPNDRERATRLDQLIVREVIAPVEYRVRHKDGRWLHVEDRSVLLPDESGQPLKLVGCTVDVTDRVLAERALKQNEARFRLALQNSGVLVYTSDSELRYTWIQNPHPAFEVELVLGRRDDELLSPEQAAPLIAMKQRVLDSGLGEQGEFSVELAGKRHTYNLSVEPLFDENQRQIGVTAAAMEITARKEAEERVETLLDELRAADRRKDDFLATLAHELRNPLAPIKSSLELMKLASGEAEVREQVRSMIERQVSQMVRLIDDLLDVSRITKNKLELKRERFDLASVLHHAVEANRSLRESAGHEISLRLPQEPVYLDADPTRLAQVFSNLLTNACKFTEKNGLIALTARRQGSEVWVTVKDSGIGIPPGMIPKLFDMFTQGDRSLERSAGGLGIGLSLVKRLVEMHDGTVTAYSEGEGQGSEFTVRLPILLEKPKVEALAGSPKETIRARPHRILVVDDNGDAAKSLAMLLKRAGNDTQLAHDGVEAVERTAEFEPDVVLLDIGLPRMNGYDACRAIRELPGGKNLLIVALTGWGQDEDRRKSYDAGFDYHLVKPVDPETLMELLAKSQPRSA